MSSINFDNPWLLFLALPLAALFVVPFFIAIRKDNVNGHNIASGIIHIIMAVIIAFVAAGASVVTTVTQTDVYVLADVSYSANKNLDTVDGYIRELNKNLPDNSRLGVICFGRDYQLITRLGEKIKSVKTAEVDDSATDIAGALDYAGSLFRDNVVKRIVVITDGKQTGESDPNALKRQIDALADRKVHVDAIYLDDNIADDAREVQLSGVRFTQTACLNREERATVTINCSCPATVDDKPYVQEAVLVLLRNGEEAGRKTAHLSRGVNNESFVLKTDEEGTYDYEVKIECSEDENSLNNRLSFTQSVSGEMKILLISGKHDGAGNPVDDDYLELRALYGEDAEIDAYNYLPDPTIPCTVEELCLYDEIVISDADLTKLQNSDIFLQSLDTAVSLFGKSLVTFGNVYVQSYAAGELRGLGDMLPVNFGDSDSEGKIYTFVIDNSRSMEKLSKLDRAKTAAIEAINMLSDDNMVALVAFNGEAFPLSNPVPLSTDREKIISLIEGIQVRQGTDIEQGLQQAFNFMKAGNYTERRALLFSDGINFGNADSCIELVREMRKYSIFTSVLDVGRGAVSNINAETLLRNICTAGGGTADGNPMDISTDANLEDVILNQLPQVGSPTESGKPSWIKVKRSKDDVLNGIDQQLLTSRQTFVNSARFSSAKSNANTVLTVNFNASGLTRDVPLYSYWDYGNGKVSSFTGAMSGANIANIGRELRHTLFKNVLLTNTPKEKVEEPFLLEMTSEEGYTHVVLTPDTVRADANTVIEITSPDESVTVGSLSFGTSSFAYDFVTPDVGKYAVKITYEYGGRTFTVNRTVHVSYSSEYDSFTLYDAAVLHKAVGANGTVSEDGKLKIVNDASEIGLYNMSLAMPLLTVCVVLYAVDIAVRKLKWEDIKSLLNKLKGKRVR